MSQSNALPGEPHLMLLARDLAAPEIVRDLAEIREVEIEDKIAPEEARAHVESLRQLANDMEEWRAQNDGAWLSEAEADPATPADMPLEDGLFRRRPSYVTAFQITEEQADKPAEEWPEWTAPMFDRMSPEDFERNTNGAIGWWMIKDEASNVFTVSDPVFTATFDRVR